MTLPPLGGDFGVDKKLPPEDAVTTIRR